MANNSDPINGSCVLGIDARISDIPGFIPAPSEVITLASLKPVADMLDGLICAWIGIEHLKAEPLAWAITPPQSGCHRH